MIKVNNTDIDAWVHALVLVESMLAGNKNVYLLKSF